MKPERVTPTQRQAVLARARGRCEYCHTPDGFVPGSFAVEHIVPPGHYVSEPSRHPAVSQRRRDPMSHINWRPMTAEDEAQMMEHLDPEEREILAAQNAKEYAFPPPASPEEVRRFQT